MREHGRTTATVLAVSIAVLGVVGALVIHYRSPAVSERRMARRQAADAHRRFIARFDSLDGARLRPALYRSGTFTASGFDSDRKTWTITIAASDWDRRPEGSRKDLAVGLLTAFSGARAQAGGNPDEAVLIIKDEDGDHVARCTLSEGTVILE